MAIGGKGSTDPLGLRGLVLKETFQFDEVVARGGFGLVYRGRHLSLGKQIAIKVFCLFTAAEASLEAEAIKHFLQEVEILSKLEHPAIVRPYDCGTITTQQYGDVPWMALEWLDGITLSDFIREREGTLWSPREAFELLRPVMEAVAEAHAHGIAHRDIAPNNIIVCDTPTGRRIRLIDFGIAVIRSYYENSPQRAPTQSGMIAYSARYPSPEQVLCHRTGSWTDVHALGLILHHLMTGQLPYPDGAQDPERGACSLRRPTPGLVGVDVGAWEIVLSQAVSLDPAARQRTAQQLLDDLQRTLTDAVPGKQNLREALPEGWRLVELSSESKLILLNTPEETVVFHIVVPSYDDLRQGVELLPNAGLGCRLFIQRYADVSIALTVSDIGGDRAGLYSTPNGVGSRLNRVLLEASSERTIYCGNRTAGLQRVICRSVHEGSDRARPTINIPEVKLRVRFLTNFREFIVLHLDEPQFTRVHLACIGIS